MEILRKSNTVLLIFTYVILLTVEFFYKNENKMDKQLEMTDKFLKYFLVNIWSSLKKPMGFGSSSEVEYLPNIYKALGSVPRITKTQTKIYKFSVITSKR